MTYFNAESRLGRVAFWGVAVMLLAAFVHFEGWNDLFLGWLLIFAGIACEDLKSGSYPLSLGIAFMLYSVLLGIASGGCGVMATKLIGGLAMVSVSWFLRKQIGAGDGAVMVGVLFALGHRAWLNIFFMAALCGVVQYVTRSICCLCKDTKKPVEIIFTPLLLIGTLLYALIE